MHDIELIALADIGAARDDFAAIIIFLQPGDNDGRIETAGIGQYDFLDFLFCHNAYSFFC